MFERTQEGRSRPRPKGLDMLKKISVIVAAIIALTAVILAVRIATLKPAMRATTELVIEPTPERLARGEYLFHHVSDCLACHSDHLWDKWTSPVKPGTEGMGGFTFGESEGVPGEISAPNITPDKTTGIGEWTDDEIVRAIREGVSRDGTALFPMMPYNDLREMSDEDVHALVAYLRTIPAVKNAIPERRLDFPVNIIVKTMPRPLEEPVPAPDKANTIAYGRYMTVIAGCIGCHTPRDEKGAPLMDQAYSGGFEMIGPWGHVVTANLTPAPGTYIGVATREDFIRRFKAFDGQTADSMQAVEKNANTIMPWLAFSGMTEEDLGAIHDFLKSLPPVEKQITTFPKAGS